MSQSPTISAIGVVDNSVGVDTGGNPRGATYTPAYGRGSYFQKTHAFSSEANLIDSNFLEVNSFGPPSSYNFSIYQYGDTAGFGFASGVGGAISPVLYLDTASDLVPVHAGLLGSNANPWGSVYASNFYGSGAGLTNVPASSITGTPSPKFESQPIVVQSASYTLTDADRGTRQVFNSNTTQQFTLGTPSSTAFANGWFFIASNTGLAPITLQPPSGRLIDGQPSISLAPHTLAVVTSDGTNYFTSLAGSGGERLVDFYETTQNSYSVPFSIPPGFHHLHLLCTCKTTATAQTVILGQINSDYNSNDYVRQYVYSTGSTITSGRETNWPALVLGQANTASAPYWAVNDTIISLGSSTTTLAGSVGSVSHSTLYFNSQLTSIDNTSIWTGSGAVQTLTLFAGAGYFASGSTFYLYGY